MKLIVSAAAALVLASGAQAADLVIRSVNVTPIARPDADADSIRSPRGSRAAAMAADTEPAEVASPAEHATAPALVVFPVAGTVGRDLFIPYYVDVDPGATMRDFNCTKFTFGTHTGEDPYIRSFREQAIGVPVFVPMDGYVADVHDGEPDENIVADTTAASNYVIVDAGHNTRIRFQHLKRGSITVKKGDRVSAGTQIALVGSSGASAAPHVHFDITKDGKVLEPMSGACRPGRSLFVDPPATAFQPTAIGAALSNQSFGVYRAAPYDDTPRTGTFLPGQQTIYVKLNIASLPPGSNYVVALHSPSGAVVTARSALTAQYDLYLASVWWALDVNFDRTGSWMVTVDVNGTRLADLPLLVVGDSSQIANRAPAPAVASIEPVGLRAGEVPLCRAGVPLVADPDYDIVQYHYQWNVDGKTVRDVTTAATSDAIPRDAVRPGSNVNCSVTVSDGRLQSATATAYATTAGGRRYSAAH